jgi:hypothetical protein
MEEPELPVYYRVGPWVLRQGGEDEEHYLTVVGRVGERQMVGGSLFDPKTGTEVMLPDYLTMLVHFEHSPKGHEVALGVGLNRIVRALRSGGGGADDPASAAGLAAAVLLAENRRMPELSAVNPMFLDLIDRQQFDWSHLTVTHPMARGGGDTDKGESLELAIDRLMEWLSGMSLSGHVEFETYGERPNQAAGRDVEDQIATLIHERCRSTADGHAIVERTLHLPGAS